MASQDAQHRPVLVVSHERSGTHLLIDTLRRNFPACRARPRLGANPHDVLYCSVDRLADDHPRPITVERAGRVLARAPRPLLKSHATPAFEGFAPGPRAWLEAALGSGVVLWIVRDGRAVMPAYHLHRRAVDPATPAGLSEFLRAPVAGVVPPARWARHAEAWRERSRVDPRVHAVRFEDLLADPRGELERLADALGEPARPADPILPPRGASPWNARLARLTGRLRSTNLVERAPRPPKWREAFTRDDRADFDRHAGDTLIRLGYEPDHAWVADPANRPADGGAAP
ncbi:MAG: sulfotransferase [Phycisphaerales bacterium JB040]